MSPHNEPKNTTLCEHQPLGNTPVTITCIQFQHYWKNSETESFLLSLKLIKLTLMLHHYDYELYKHINMTASWVDALRCWDEMPRN